MLAYNPLPRWVPVVLVGTGAVVGGALIGRALTRRAPPMAAPLPKVTAPPKVTPAPPPPAKPSKPAELFTWLSPPGPKQDGPDMRDAIIHSQTPMGDTYEDVIYILTSPYDGPLCITGGVCQYVVMYRSTGDHGWEIVKDEAAAITRARAFRAEHVGVA